MLFLSILTCCWMCLYKNWAHKWCLTRGHDFLTVLVRKAPPQSPLFVLLASLFSFIFLSCKSLEEAAWRASECTGMEYPAPRRVGYTLWTHCHPTCCAARTPPSVRQRVTRRKLNTFSFFFITDEVGWRSERFDLLCVITPETSYYCTPPRQTVRFHYLTAYELIFRITSEHFWAKGKKMPFKSDVTI